MARLLDRLHRLLSPRLGMVLVAALMVLVMVADILTPQDIVLIPFLSILALAGSTFAPPLSTMGLGLLAVVCALTSASVEGQLSRHDFPIDALGLLATCVFAAIASRQRVTKERLLHQRALTDVLTGLPNRSVTHSILHRELRRRDVRHPITVLFVDVDRFKGINDQYGHAAGDAVLREIARRLSSTVRAEDVVTRYAGDEFVIICTSIEDQAAAEALCRRVAASLADPIDLGDRQQLTVSASIGGILARDRQGTAEELLAHADAAMFAAKTSGHGHRIVVRRDHEPGPSGSSPEMKRDQPAEPREPRQDFRPGASGGG